MKIKKIITTTFSFVAFAIVFYSCDTTEPGGDPPNPPGYQVDIPWPSLAESPWPMYQKNPQNMGRSNFRGAKEGKIEWSLFFDEFSGASTDVFSAPVMADDSTIYLIKFFNPDDSTRLYSISTSGKIKWSFVLGRGKNLSSPIIAADGTIYVSHRNNKIFALTKDGNLKWELELPSPFLGEFSIGKNGNIYGVTQFKNLYSITSNGSIEWVSSSEDGFNWVAQNRIGFSPDGNTIYVGGDQKSLYAVKTLDGSINWSFDNGGRLRHSPIIDSQGNIYIAPQNPTDNSKAGFISLTPDGEIRYIFKDFPGRIWNDPVIDKQGNIFIAAFEIISLDYNGNLRFRKLYEFASISGCPITCDGEGNIYFVSDDRNSTSTLYCLDNDGNDKWHLEIGYVSRTVTIGKDRLYLAVNGNKKELLCIK